ncbi:Uncharacterized protein APZ42_011085 [Daphnia magna]|uniref:Uncharacterized protein n=1 Tax=Daphnia magna TaxID=35525 RepID=A0A162T6N3_9CRUS|nr:Uncharacterized protein APZ42_011085 [Daphnia magna]
MLKYSPNEIVFAQQFFSKCKGRSRFEYESKIKLQTRDLTNDTQKTPSTSFLFSLKIDLLKLFQTKKLMYCVRVK